jgi:hypothetical protein
MFSARAGPFSPSIGSWKIQRDREPRCYFFCPFVSRPVLIGCCLSSREKLTGQVTDKPWNQEHAGVRSARIRTLGSAGSSVRTPIR